MVSAFVEGCVGERIADREVTTARGGQTVQGSLRDRLSAASSFFGAAATVEGIAMPCFQDLVDACTRDLRSPRSRYRGVSMLLTTREPSRGTARSRSGPSAPRFP